MTGVVKVEGFVTLGATGAGTFGAQFSKITSGTGTAYPGSTLKMFKVI